MKAHGDQESLLEGLAPRLKELGRGGYARTYTRGGRSYDSDTAIFVSKMLDSLGLSYDVNAEVKPGAGLFADFVVGGDGGRKTAIFVERELSEDERGVAGSAPGMNCLFVTTSELRSDRFDSGLRAVGLSEGQAAPERGRAMRLQTIFLDDPSFNFDYAHILPKTEKCSVMHGHTSSALVEVIGSPTDGMVVDFNDAKPIIRDAIRDLDHKLFINEKYVVRSTKTHIELGFDTVHGRFDLRVPRGTTVLLDGEATVENLARELLLRIAPKMPGNVEAVGVYVYEGLNKGTHLLARIHSKRDSGRRSRGRRRGGEEVEAGPRRPRR